MLWRNLNDRRNLYSPVASLEDADISDAGKLESESVTNQRKMLRDYAAGNPTFADADVLEFCDDGYSGKNFERPGFTASLKWPGVGASSASSSKMNVCQRQ